MVALYRRNDNFGTVWAIPHLDPEGATAAELTNTIAGTAAGPATMGLYIGGERYAVTIAAGDDAEVIAHKIAAAVNADPFALVTAEAGAEGAEGAAAPRSRRSTLCNPNPLRFPVVPVGERRRDSHIRRAARRQRERHLHRQEHGRDRQRPAARLELPRRRRRREHPARRYHHQSRHWGRRQWQRRQPRGRRRLARSGAGHRSDG